MILLPCPPRHPRHDEGMVVAGARLGCRGSRHPLDRDWRHGPAAHASGARDQPRVLRPLPIPTNRPLIPTEARLADEAAYRKLDEPLQQPEVLACGEIALTTSMTIRRADTARARDRGWPQEAAPAYLTAALRSAATRWDDTLATPRTDGANLLGGIWYRLGRRRARRRRWTSVPTSFRG